MHIDHTDIVNPPDIEALHKQILDNAHKVKVKAVRREDLPGKPYLAARCPQCGTAAGVSGGTVHLCRGCNTLLEYVVEG